MDKKQKILCLHGYEQTSDQFRKQISVMRKYLERKGYEFVFVQAPHQVGVDAVGNPTFGWFTKQQIPEDQNYLDYIGYDESISYIIKFVNDNGPFDAILGFSQGAIMTGIILAQNLIKSLGFGVLIAGYKSQYYKHKSLFDTRVTLPTLHIYGETDRVVTVDRSEYLAEFFDNKTALKHKGGHLVPQDAQNKKIIFEYFESRRQL